LLRAGTSAACVASALWLAACGGVSAPRPRPSGALATDLATATPPDASRCGPGWRAAGALPSQVTFSSIWGSGPDDVWVTGEQGTLLHWDGAGWSAASSGTSQALRAVMGTSKSNVWAAGLDGTFLHFDGRSWSSMRPGGAPWSPAPGPGVKPFYALYAAAEDDLWVAGFGVRHFDGTRWSEPVYPTGLPIKALGGVGSQKIWMVGNEGALRAWDGRAWLRVPHDRGPDFFGLWANAADDVWAVGSNGAILHWDGHVWKASPSGTGADLYGVRGFGPSDVWAVGDRGTILHWDGWAWSATASPSTHGLLGVWGASAGDVWIVGEDGTILRRRATCAVTSE
jgi:hypothetical protein